MQTPRLAVFVSGTGSILEAMIDQKIPIELVMADRECRGLEIAKSQAIDTEILSRTFGKSFDRHQYTQDTISMLIVHNIDLVAMAGYMTVFDAVIFEQYGACIINIHPSLLPSFKGERAVALALEFGVKVTGTTIHYATRKLDEGPIIAQEAVPVLPSDTVETLHERIKVVERRLYPATIRDLLANFPN